MKNGLKPEEGVVMAEELAEMGFDGIEVSCGIGEDGGSTLRGDLPFTQGFNRESASLCRRRGDRSCVYGRNYRK